MSIAYAKLDIAMLSSTLRLLPIEQYVYAAGRFIRIYEASSCQRMTSTSGGGADVPGLPNRLSVLFELWYAAYTFNQYCYVSILMHFCLLFSQ